ncbi:hypothetical protein ILUMI_22079 [Ignelater luminosus]|uniref:Mutator-like transposase domain-containing protein n=1 Tax=Ignelater luminosus TaxID=2038154 RepID=A0A8K0CF86_IGNLU|nr:hypothetical protein ILUMI_22079 [Ignelater luminosus]
MRCGITSTFQYHCDTCDKTININTHPNESRKDVNESFVWGTLSVGMGYSQSEELRFVLDIPCMSKKTFRKEKLREYIIKTGKKRKRRYRTNDVKDDKDYGPNAEQVLPDLPEEEFLRTKKRKLEEIESCTNDIKKIQINTIGQHSNELWNEFRKDRLTAS